MCNPDSHRKTAAQGEFFFAKFLLSDGREYPRPVFVVGNAGNDSRDVIVCSCTAQPKRTDFDVPVQLKRKTHIRTNKIYTVQRDSLLFKMESDLTGAALESTVKRAIAAIQTS